MSKRKKIKLKKELGIITTTLCGVGIILGAGIYVLVGKAAAIGGNTIWASFGLAALVATLTGMSYAELSSMFPQAGAEYVYTKHAFGKRISFFVGFFFITALTIAVSAVSLGFAGYFNALFGTPVILTAVTLIVLCTLILLYGVKQSAIIGALFTLVEAGGLFIIIAIGLPRLGQISLTEMAPSGVQGVFGAAALIFFAYIGFEQIANLASETKDASKIIPRAILYSIIISTIIYILVALSAISVMGWAALGASSAPLADVAVTVFGPGVFTIISVIALFSTGNTVLLVLLANSRLSYGMVKEQKLKLLSWVHPSQHTPWVTIILVSLFSILFLFTGGIEKVADMTNMAIFVTFIFINSSVIALRFKMPSFKRPFKVPGSLGKLPIIPLAGLLTNLFMLTYVGFHAIIYGLIFSAAALVAYEIITRKQIID